jgi:Skp family chaperone for outer membrane proteins
VTNRIFLAALLAAFICAGSRLQAQAPATPPPVATVAPAVTKVGVVNIGAVFMKYQKAEFFKKETESILKPFRDEGEKLKKLAMDWESALRAVPNKLTDEQKKQGERTIIDVKRRLEDLDRDARNKIGKRNEEQIVQLYKEINQAVGSYAAANGFHLILAYGEPPLENDLLSFMNISRKMQAMDSGSVIPIYFTPGLDVSQPIIDTLNRNYGGAPTAVSNNTK